jgi:hypothetical protein
LALFLFLRLTTPVGVTALVGIPFVLLLIALPVHRRRVLLLGALVAAMVVVGAAPEGLWYVERGWAVLAGALFAALSLWRPGLSVTHRALAAVGGAAAVAAGGFLARPGAWSVVDWSMRERVVGAVAQALMLVRDLGDGSVVTPEVESSIFQTAEVQAQIFPALLALGTVAALVLAWWGYTRMAVGRTGAIGRLRDFSFEDQLVWVFIAGLGLAVLASGEGLTRAGTNTVVFMGALYALRGAAVFLFLNGGISILGGVLLALAMLYVAPILAMAAMIVGLGDTWLDVRAKVRAMAG